GEQSALLVQNAPVALEQMFLKLLLARHYATEHLERTRAWLNEADDGPQQHRFAGARCRDRATDFTFCHLEADAIKNGGEPEADHKIAHAQRHIVRRAASDL